jgi:hypothetical protein
MNDERKSEGMEVEYVLGMEEVLAFNLYVHRHAPALRRRTWTARLTVPAICLGAWVMLAGFVQEPGPVIVLGVFLGVIALAFFLAFPSRARHAVVRLVQRLYSETNSRGAFGRRRMTITPDTVTEAGELTVTTKKWAAVDKIVEDQRHVYFYVSALSAFILPKSAFPNEDAFRAFLETAERYHREAPN